MVRLGLFWEKPRPTWDSGQERTPNSSSSEATVLIAVSVVSIERGGDSTQLLSTCVSFISAASAGSRKVTSTDLGDR